MTRRAFSLRCIAGSSRANSPGLPACTARPRASCSSMPTAASPGRETDRLRRVGVLAPVWDEIHGRDRGRHRSRSGGRRVCARGHDAALPAGGARPAGEGGPRSRRRAGVPADSQPRHAGSPLRQCPSANSRVVLHCGTRSAAANGCRRRAGLDLARARPSVADLDAIYINFISGFEMGLGTGAGCGRRFQFDLRGPAQSVPRDATGRHPDAAALPDARAGSGASMSSR